jgi:hypothetical protein
VDSSDTSGSPADSHEAWVVISGDADEALLAETSFSHCTWRQRLGYEQRNTHLAASLSFLVLEVTPVFNGNERLVADGGLRLRGHVYELIPVMATCRPRIICLNSPGRPV